MTENEKFLRSEFWTQSWNGSVQIHRQLYNDPKNKDVEKIDKGIAKKFKDDKIEFRKCLIKFCEDGLLPMYESQGVFESVHCQNIEELKKHANSCPYKHVLFESHYNIGVAQKLLNLRLKYLWCAGKIARPTHCPVDGIILRHVKWPGEPWTRWECIDEYKAAIAWIKKSTGNKHIADWELYTFNKIKVKSP